jgi:hypothetical protein
VVGGEPDGDGGLVGVGVELDGEPGGFVEASEEGFGGVAEFAGQAG